MFTADFCVSPDTNTIQNIDPTSSYFSTITYYITCLGTNPNEQYVSQASQAINGMYVATEALYKSQSTCVSQTQKTNLNYALSELLVMNTTLNQLNTLIECPAIQNGFEHAIQTGLCQQIFSGYYTIWITTNISTAFLFFTTIFVSLIYQFFGKLFEVEATAPIPSDHTLPSDNVNNNPLNPNFREESDISNVILWDNIHHSRYSDHIPIASAQVVTIDTASSFMSNVSNNDNNSADMEDGTTTRPKILSF